MHCIPCMHCLICVSLGDVWGTVCPFADARISNVSNVEVMSPSITAANGLSIMRCCSQPES
jgi:hypothetical protein